MQIINLSSTDSVIHHFLAELRSVDYQTNPLLFRNNIRRIGQLMAYEISKTFQYVPSEIETPLAKTQVNLFTNQLVLSTVFRAGLPLHEGFLDVFDHAECAFISAYRTYTDAVQTEVGINVEYMATPRLEGKTLIIADPMLATGGSMELAYRAFIEKAGNPEHIHVASVIATPTGIETIKRSLPEDRTTIWCAAIDSHLNEHKYIVTGLGDAGDLCYGEKL